MEGAATNRAATNALARVRALLGDAGERVRLTWPLAARSLRTRRAGFALMALSVAIAVSVFLLFSAYFNATERTVARRVRPLDLPGDLVVRGILPLSPQTVNDLGRQANVRSLTTAVTADLLTSFGRVEVFGLPGRLLEPGGVALDAGRVPESAGEILLPTSLARRAGLSPGDVVGLTSLNGGKLAIARVTVVGLGQSRGGYLAGHPLMNLEGLEEALPVAPNLACLEIDQPQNLGRVEAYVRGLPIEGGQSLSVVTADSPKSDARRLVGGLFSPGRVAVFLVYVFAAVGLLNIVLLSFLQRKRSLGVLKAVGLDNDDLLAFLLIEGLLTTAVGLVAGYALSTGLIWWFNRFTALNFIPSFGAYFSAAGVALTVFGLASWLPITLTRRASVNALLQNRRVYLDPTSACAQCGRCGGF